MTAFPTPVIEVPRLGLSKTTSTTSHLKLKGTNFGAGAVVNVCAAIDATHRHNWSGTIDAAGVLGGGWFLVALTYDGSTTQACAPARDVPPQTGVTPTKAVQTITITVTTTDGGSNPHPSLPVSYDADVYDQA